ncbi:hypothetical protein GALMADRAFT_153889 [Galerina marginata CBS 339.88]|uniref:Malate dehydrogenase n=1 Tax=Galerina marginata (strain CBS 339.88) TaxID=685588 RepID=A0A067TMN2_GALM3|nr:hypothetical protein GALMADRAFT_153889 [Galerina marginata CBS 339.88]
MIAFTTFISLAVSVPLLTVSGSALKRSGCSLKGHTTPSLPAPLVAPTDALSWVGLAIGTQNYTCSSAGTYTNVGALAELFDVSCLVQTSIFPALQDIAIAAWEAAPPTVTAAEVIKSLHGLTTPAILGQHYYVVNPVSGIGINPKWDFTSQGSLAGNKEAFVVAAKVNGASAPTGSKDIDWVQLGALAGAPALAGELAKEVYRTDTRLGQPPASCTAGSAEIVVKYAAKYYGFGGSV